MGYWKALIVAVLLDLGWMMGNPSTVLGPAPLGPAAVQVEAALSRLDTQLDYVRAHPEDVRGLEQLAALYIENQSYDAAVGPLARALQIDPSRRSLWTALDRAVKQGGRGTISDAELMRRAAEFKTALARY